MPAYSDPHLNQMYDLLFCDEPEEIAALTGPTASDEQLSAVMNDLDASSRQKIAAANLLRARGISDTDSHLFGIVVEVSMREGLDVLAVYEDGTARYINYSGKLVIWESATDDSDKLVKDLLAAARMVVENIGPWPDERLPPPVEGNARLTFLVADGLYFGEGRFDLLAADPMGGAVIDRAGKFMAYLVDQTMAQSP
jgi:hypothetical protein